MRGGRNELPALPGGQGCRHVGFSRPIQRRQFGRETEHPFRPSGREVWQTAVWPSVFLLRRPHIGFYGHLVDSKREGSDLSVVITPYQKTCYTFVNEKEDEALFVDVHAETRISLASLVNDRSLLRSSRIPSCQHDLHWFLPQVVFTTLHYS